MKTEISGTAPTSGLRNEKTANDMFLFFNTNWFSIVLHNINFCLIARFHPPCHLRASSEKLGNLEVGRQLWKGATEQLQESRVICVYFGVLPPHNPYRTIHVWYISIYFPTFAIKITHSCRSISQSHGWGGRSVVAMRR